MKKLVFLGVIAGLLLALPALAVKPNGPSAYNGLNKGKSQMKHLYLYEKNQTTWEVVEGGAFGKMTFNDEKFVFNGHGLMPETSYTLLRYTDPWETHTAVCLGTEDSNEEGDVHVAGLMKDGGPKVWLVLSSDVNCGTEKMVGWHGAKYLMEYNLLY